MEVIEFFDKSERFNYKIPEELNEIDEVFNDGSSLKVFESEPDGEERLQKSFVEWVEKNYAFSCDECKEDLKIICKICRDFLRVLERESKEIDHHHPLWRGVRKLKDDETFFKFFNILMPQMWS
jgi:hypothetical protein